MKGKKNLLLILTAILGLFLISCDSEKSLKSTDQNRIVQLQGDPKGRVHEKNKVISLKSIGENKASNRKENFSLVLRAEVDAPTFNGQTLRASHVRIRDNYAYVTYNYEGSVFLGGIDIFDVSDIQNPRLITQAYFNNTDVTSVDFSNNKIFLAEQTNIDNEQEFTTGAVLEKLHFDGTLLTSENRIDLPSYAATGVTVDNNMLHVTTGNDASGGLLTFSKDDLSLLNTYNFSDARYVNANSDYLVALKGTPATLLTFDKTNGNFIDEYSVNGAEIPESKSTFDLVRNMAFVATGNEGMKVINLLNGEIIQTIPKPDIPENGIPGDYVTNAVSVNGEDLTFIANGAAGVYVATWKDCNSLEVLGSIDFQSSTNYVESKNNIVFVATGKGGLKILEVNYVVPEYETLGEWNNQGLPDYLDTDDFISEEFIQKINETFVNGSNLHCNNPEYFYNVDTNITMETDGELWVTYVKETAGWNNTLGYYYYDINNPPSTYEELTHKTIIYPNFSNYILNPGNKVQLKLRDGSTTFPAGTVIGFFLNANSWVNSQITDGLHTNYTNKEWNNNYYNQTYQQNVLLNDETTKRKLLAFEDNKLPYGDKDFSDAIFYVTSQPENSIKTDNMATIQE